MENHPTYAHSVMDGPLYGVGVYWVVTLCVDARVPHREWGPASWTPCDTLDTSPAVGREREWADRG